MPKDSRSDKPFDAAGCSVPTVRAARRATYTMFFADGIGFGIWAGHIPAFKQKFQLSDSSLSIVLLAVAAGSIISMPLALRHSARVESGSASPADTLLQRLDVSKRGSSGAICR